MRTKKGFDTEVVILTNERDFTADDVVRYLAAVSVPTSRLNIEQAVYEQVPSWRPKNVGSVPRVVWWRQFSFDKRPNNLREADDLLVQRLQWSTWLSTLNAPQSRWVNPLWAARRAENKIEQLRAAGEVALSIPRTLITNSEETAKEFVSEVGRPCIIKSLGTAYFELSDRSFVFSQMFSPDLVPSEGWNDQPLVVQEAITDGEDVRVFIFGKACFAASTPRSPGRSLDWRLENDVVWSRHSPPQSLIESCRRYLQFLDLRYGAFDFIHVKGRYWFLEANQAGEWGWLDRQLDLGVSAAFAEYLGDLANSE